MEDMKYEDKPLADRPTTSFQWCGVFDEANVGMKTVMPKHATMSLDKLRQVRVESNANVVKRLRSSDDKAEAEVWRQVQEDCRFGSMIEPKIATPDLLRTISVTRRIPILQEKDDGSEKVRVVDHATESWFKEATTATETMQTERIEVAIIMCLMLMTYGHQVRMAKRDVKRAFRQLPLDIKAFGEFLWVIFAKGGDMFVSQHLACPFGATSSTHSSHRVAEFMCACCRRLTLCPNRALGG